MKQQLPLALAAFTCLALASTASLAQNVTIYGRLALTTNQVKTGSSSTVRELRDNASRLGFRGVEDMGGGLRASFGLEMGYSADSGQPGEPLFRNSYVALHAGWGIVALGRLDSANPTGSPIYSQIVTLTSFAPNDAGATATSTSMQNARNRTSNSIGYSSPKWQGLNLRARHYLRGAGTTADPEDSSKSWDVGLNYERGDFKAGLGYSVDTRRGGLANNEFDDKWQVGMSYEPIKGLDLYTVFGEDTYKNTATRRRDVQYWQVGAAYRTGAHKVVFNLFERDVQSSLTGVRKRTQLSYQYFLSTRTDLQAFYDNDGIDSSRTNVRVKAIGMGVRHNF